MILDEITVHIAQCVAYVKRPVSSGELRGTALKSPKGDLRSIKAL